MKNKYDYIGEFYCNLACVRLNNKWNYIDRTGKLLSERWFYNAVGFIYFWWDVFCLDLDRVSHERCGLVYFDPDTYYYITKNGDLLYTNR